MIRKASVVARHPGEVADVLFKGFPAFGAGKMLTVRAEPSRSNTAATGQGFGVYLPHILNMVVRIGHVGAVQANSHRVMIDGVRYRTVQRLL